ncbi:hypothetical protein BD311DRAFT_676953 [Dichomitus squalens]|uniref:Uncharacterized protein n=1 Tax=Dichomitus squalens TaxID=114155 RepID=A0A4Q9M8N9_9APHY|nr:hypothetical protein BD311DRAFT_676953 [Dichomitus squalens]
MSQEAMRACLIIPSSATCWRQAMRANARRKPTICLQKQEIKTAECPPKEKAAHTTNTDSERNDNSEWERHNIDIRT